MTMTITLAAAMSWTEESDIFMARRYPDETQAALIATHVALLEVLERERVLIKRTIAALGKNGRIIADDCPICIAKRALKERNT